MFPSAETLADIACLAAEEVRRFDLEPRLVRLSFSNFGSTHHRHVDRVR